MTGFFHRLLLNIFAGYPHDAPEEATCEMITRVILERLVGYWPHPWGLVLTVVELVRNEQYGFFDLQFLKTSPDVLQRFVELAQRAHID
jgi:CCR4-NOT transcription complex subunit 1